MAIANGWKWSLLTRTLCIIVFLPAIFAFPNNDKKLKLVAHKQRSLNNYIAASMPYIVDHRRNIYADELFLNDAATAGTTLTEKADDDVPSRDDERAQEMLDCVNANHCANGSSGVVVAAPIEGTFKPYSQDELNKILKKYETDKDQLETQESTNKIVATAANYYSINNASPENAVAESSSAAASSNAADPDDKSKGWNTVNYSPPPSQNTINKNPYDDRLGWVTLEPIPWSSSQVQKWEPNSKPNWPSPPSNNVPWGSNSISRPSSSHLHQQQQHTSNTYGGGAFSDRPYKKPTYQYESKPWSTSNQNNYNKPQFTQHYGNDDIITDGQPGYFPSDRPSSSLQSSYNSKPWLEHTHSLSYTDSNSHPTTQVVYQGVGAGSHSYRPPDREPGPGTLSTDGDGHWVLLSSTKGYSAPHRQRSDYGRLLDAGGAAVAANLAEPTAVAAKKSRPISARRSIRLTVLPSLDGPKATVTSHNGMIERDANDQTVEEAHREHLARMMKFGNSTDNEVQITKSSSFHGIPAKVETVSKPYDRRNAILKTVGAGVLPATMAVLLPMITGRRKRSIVQPSPKIASYRERLENTGHFDKIYKHATVFIDEIPF